MKREIEREIEFDFGCLIEENRNFEFTLLPTIICRRDNPDFQIVFGWLFFYFSIEFNKYGC
jgi:hypothetical protein